MYTPSQLRGYFTIMTMVFASVFLLMTMALTGYIFTDKKLQAGKEAREEAFHIAEAGLEYYRWHLAHYPNDLQDGTGQPGPYTHVYYDPEGAAIGEYTLTISGQQSCGKVVSVDITSVGKSYAAPQYTRSLTAKYTKPSVAEFSAITNSNVWAGADRVISGPYHSNGGIRMDGTHNATVSSGVSTWLCTSTFGCNPSTNQNGVFGAGQPQSLWEYPAPAVDFGGISIDLAELKAIATSSGLYLGPSGGHGYRVTFNANGTVNIRRVNGTTQIWGYTTENGWQQERTVMSNVQAQTTYTLPPSCPVVFIEDNAWIEGTISGKMTLAVANLGAGSDRSIILNGDVTYASSTGHGLTAIAEKDILVGLQVPDTMTINGIYIAQNGRFGRNHYCTNECDNSNQGNEGLPSSLDQYVTRSTLSVFGTVVSNGRIGTKWTSGGTFLSGFAQRYDSFDRSLSTSPPAFTPVTSDDFRFVEWRQNR